MKLDLLNRVITAAALVALAITLGVWLTRSPLTAAPAATPAVAPFLPPAKPVPPAKAMPEPTLAPLPLPAPAIPTTVTTEVEIEFEIAPLPSPPTPVVADPPRTEPAENPQTPANCRQYFRRGWFRRR
jgi:hypothetical protein